MSSDDEDVIPEFKPELKDAKREGLVDAVWGAYVAAGVAAHTAAIGLLEQQLQTKPDHETSKAIGRDIFLAMAMRAPQPFKRELERFAEHFVRELDANPFTAPPPRDPEDVTNN